MSTTQKLVVAIDASRNRSGGAKAHLIGILSKGNPLRHGISQMHVWSYKALLDALPERPWLVKHCPEELNGSLAKQLWWQWKKLCPEAMEKDTDIMLTTDASSLCRFRPMVVMSQDMLSYEPGVMRQFGYTTARLRLLAILYLQNRAFRRADGVIFLTRYAAKVIQESCGTLRHIAIIPHGVSNQFKNVQPADDWTERNGRPVRCLYISNTAMHKHQWVVVKAIAALRKRGYDLCISLVGGGSGRAQALLDRQIAISDPDRVFVEQTGFLPQEKLPSILANAHLFIFASSCENMPNTLLEAMAAGLPIACSNRGPMPEVLQNGGVYFDPEDSESIAQAIEKIITDEKLRAYIARRARELSAQYSWDRCADETFSFIVETHKKWKV